MHLCTVHSWIGHIMRLPKKKKNRKRRRWKNLSPNGHIILLSPTTSTQMSSELKDSKQVLGFSIKTLPLPKIYYFALSSFHFKTNVNSIHWKFDYTLFFVFQVPPAWCSNTQWDSQGKRQARVVKSMELVREGRFGLTGVGKQPKNKRLLPMIHHDQSRGTVITF